MAQASHGSAPDIAGKGIANPIALMLSVSLLLDWLGKESNQERFGESATAIRIGVQQLLESPSTRTADIKGNCRTEAFGTRLADLIGMSDKTRVS
jgi:3-isopropylmalate dehydrogenase